MTIKTDQTIITDTIPNKTIKLDKNANLTYIALLKKGWRDTKKLKFEFTAPNSKLTFIALIIAKKNNKFSFETISNHHKKNTSAHYYVRAITLDESEVDYTGRLNIKKGAQLSNTYLAHHTLSFSKNAKTRTIPSLEIEANNVKAGHAATIGKIDEESLFYLSSRGLNKTQAKDLLIKGFLKADLNKISDPKIQKQLSQEIDKSC